MNTDSAFSLPQHPAPAGWRIRQAAILAATLVLPLAGAAANGTNLGALAAFPPRADLAAPEWASPLAMAALALVLCSLAVLTGRRLEPPGPRTAGLHRRRRKSGAHGFPSWGIAAMLLTAAAWLVAWNRYRWAAPIQEHTFIPLWLGYIVTVNAFSRHRTGRCLLIEHPRFILGLFPVSACFWWIFEYLNRYTGNWIYLLPRPYTPLEYTALATLSFSTVLPAVASTHELLASSRLTGRFGSMWPMPDAARRGVSAALAVCSAIILALLAFFPHELYPGLWVAPLCLLVASDLREPRAVLFPGLRTGDWRDLAAWALAALVCGLFWEMWNVHSLAKWTYAIPYFGALRIFEMPLLGYAGYLPFGVECAAAVRGVAAIRARIDGNRTHSGA